MKKKERKTERFEGGVAGLFRYHRASHILLSCLLVPLIAGGAHFLWRLPGTGEPATLFFTITSVLALGWIVAGSSSALAMGHLVLYASDGGPAEKSARWRSILWHKTAVDLAGCAGFAALLGILHAFTEGLEPTFDLQVAQYYAVLAFGYLTWMLAWLFDKNGLIIRRWLLVALAHFLVCIHLSLLESPFILLLHALGLAIYITGICVRPHPLRSRLLVNACSIFSVAHIFMWLAMMAKGGTGFDWKTAALLASTGAVATFASHEIIRRGLFSAEPEFIARKTPWMSKGQLARLLDPLQGTTRRWRWVRLVIRLAPYAWLVALASSAVAVTARLASL